MKRLLIGIFAISIAFVSCNKEEVVSVSSETSFNKINKTLIEKNYSVDGVVGDLYETDNGQLILGVKELEENEMMTKKAHKLTYEKKIYNDTFGNIECKGSGNKCTFIKDGKESVIVVKL